MYCLKCGKQIADTATECDYCGCRTENYVEPTKPQIEVVATPKDPEQEANKQKAMTALIISIAGLAAMLLFPIISIPLAIVGLVLSIKGKKIPNNNSAQLNKTAMILSICTIALAILVALPIAILLLVAAFI